MSNGNAEANIANIEPRGVLNDQAIEDLKVISANLDPKQIGGDLYDLRVGHIITAEEYVWFDGEQGMDVRGRRRDAILLKPGQTATLATREEFDLPANVNGLIVPRDSFAKRGLLTLNAGHIHPRHKGFVTAQVINLTDKPFLLQLNQSYFSIIFLYLSRPATKEPRPLGDEEARIRTLRETAAQLPVSLVQKETLEEVFVSKADLTFEIVKRVSVFVIALATLAGTGVGIFAAVRAITGG